MDFFVACYIINLIVSVFAFLTTVAVIKLRKTGMKILPRGLRLYMQYCCFPYVAVINLASIYCCIYYLLFRTETPLEFSLFKFIVAFASQQVRNSFFAIVVERIIATIFFQTYKFSSKFSMFSLLTFISHIISTSYLLFLILTFYVPNWIQYYPASNWFVFFIHVITLVICSILHFVNKRMYEISVYQVPLKQRHQIFENVKVITFIFPPIVIFTSIAPFGSLVTILMRSIYNYTAPFSIFHLAYNLSFLIIAARCLILNQSTLPPKNRVAQTTSTVTVSNPFGKRLPANATVETHFNDLKLLWA